MIYKPLLRRQLSQNTVTPILVIVVPIQPILLHKIVMSGHLVEATIVTWDHTHKYPVAIVKLLVLQMRNDLF
jgi:hypothetical protein